MTVFHTLPRATTNRLSPPRLTPPLLFAFLFTELDPELAAAEADATGTPAAAIRDLPTRSLLSVKTKMTRGARMLINDDGCRLEIFKDRRVAAIPDEDQKEPLLARRV